MSSGLVWLRKDLRCRDNSALAQAVVEHNHVVCIYIHDKSLSQPQTWWVQESLKSLKISLQELGIPLYILESESPLEILKNFIFRKHVDGIYWNRSYEPLDRALESTIKKTLEEQGIKVHSLPGNVLWEPGSIRNEEGLPFKKFTPFWNKAKKTKKTNLEKTLNHGQKIQYRETSFEKTDFYEDKIFSNNFHEYWVPGEKGATELLKIFIKNLQNYKSNRDFPFKESCSYLSPHIHFGEISVKRLWNTVLEHQDIHFQSVECFLSELGWREFSYSCLFDFPDFSHANYKKEFDFFPWSMDEKSFEKWGKGLTGFPIVDAGMRELKATGYMHNRVRMVVASFLTKDMFVDWRMGARWFLDSLLDGDLANNAMGWQWSASSGPDSAPYFRIFNPTLQGLKFDPEGVYVKKWVPELRNCVKNFHEPWKNSSFGEYFPPMLSHSAARQAALGKYKQLPKIKE